MGFHRVSQDSLDLLSSWSTHLASQSSRITGVSHSAQPIVHLFWPSSCLFLSLSTPRGLLESYQLHIHGFCFLIFLMSALRLEDNLGLDQLVWIIYRCNSNINPLVGSILNTSQHKENCNIISFGFSNISVEWKTFHFKIGHLKHVCSGKENISAASFQSYW